MKKLLLLLLCVPLMFSCGEKEIGRYDFEIIEMIDMSFVEEIESSNSISPRMYGDAIKAGIKHIICRFDTKTGEIKYFDLLGNEIEKEEISKYKPLIIP